VPTPPLFASFFLAHDSGLWLHKRRWVAADGVASSRAIVYLLHGFGEHVGRYEHVAAEQTAAGVTVCGMDHQGHGHSQGDRGYFTSFASMVADAVQFITEQEAELAAEGVPRTTPRFLLGHSMGGLMGIHVAHAAAVRPLLRGLVLSGPALFFDAEVDTPTNRLLAGTLSSWLPKLPVQRLNPDRLSTEPTVVEAYQRDPLVYTGALRVRVGSEFMKAVDSALALVADGDTETVPTLILHGEADLLCDPRGSHNYIAAVASNPRYRTASPVTLHLYRGLKHEIFNEVREGREAVLADLAEWLNHRISAAAS